MSQIAFIGDTESISGFKAFGVDIYSVDDYKDAKEIFQKVIKLRYKLIFITEDLADHLEEEINKYFSQAYPIISIFPGLKESKGSGEERILKIIEQTIGSNILKEK
ncbi:MAG TPA: V-type ATP synthase subunit F [Firmicutes bacterium]|nr:V-type ATP synthase subunit F [Bacillota bacterium]